MRLSPNPFSRSILEASAWRRQLTEIGVESTPEFEAWLAEGPLNETAWRRVKTVWDFIGQEQVSPQLLDLRRAALADAQDAFRRRGRRWRNLTTGTARSRRAISIVAATAAAMAVLVVWRMEAPDVYRTQPGERLTVTLTDGSRALLDSSTELRVDFSAEGRELTLIRGQSYFRVAHEQARPFSVTANGSTVIATGTAFNVDMLGSQLQVALIEGRVVVVPQGAAMPTRTNAIGPKANGRAPLPAVPHPRPVQERGHPISAIELEAGDLLVLDARGEAAVVPANVEKVTAWEIGRMIVENETLETLVERMNRHSVRPVVIADDRVKSLRISGVFNTDDMPGLINTLTHYLPVDAERVDGGIQLKHR